MATVNDVAKLAGVSAMTVSRTLNSPESVREETRDRVLAAIEKLDYMPNRRARSLITGSFHTIAIFVPTVLNPFFGQVALGVEDEATSHGFNVILCNADSAEKQQLQLDAMIQLGVDGIVFFDMPVNRALVDRLQRAGVSAVLVDNELDVDDVCALRTNNRLGGKIATAHLIELDHHRIGHIHGRIDDGAADEHTEDGAPPAVDDAPSPRPTPPFMKAPFSAVFGVNDWRDFVRSWTRRAWRLTLVFVVEGDGTSEGGVVGGRHAMEELLALDERPTAVYAANDLMAIGAVQAVLKSGLRVPEDISIVGFDDIDLSSMIHPPLTTVHQPRREMGRESVRLLMERIDGESPVKNLLLNPSLVERGSTAAHQRSTS